jgi:hypothetical protein
MKIECARASGSRLLQNVMILSRIRELTNKLLGRLELNVESWIKDLHYLKMQCMYDPKKFNPMAALKASEQEGKYMALFKQEIQIDAPSLESGKILILPENNRELLKDKVEQKNPDRKDIKKKGK